MLDSLRPSVRAMAGYTPGEQPREDGVIKLNTNENPYPPSPKVFEAVRETLTGDRLRKYPDPVGLRFRRVAGRVLDVDPDGILIGNGSDDVLTILTRSFTAEGGLVVSPTPSYLLYRTLAELQGRASRPSLTLPTGAFPLPGRSNAPASPSWPTPIRLPGPPSRSPTSSAWRTQLRGPLVVDEAYADFGETNALPLARAGRVIVTRSLSKSYSLAGVRFGFAVSSPEIVQQLIKVKDSYNCDVLSLAAAAAALDDQEYMLVTRRRILATRSPAGAGTGPPGLQRHAQPGELRLGAAGGSTRETDLRGAEAASILVRYMVYEGYGDGLRVSVGTDAEIDRLLRNWRRLCEPRVADPDNPTAP